MTMSLLFPCALLLDDGASVKRAGFTAGIQGTHRHQSSPCGFEYRRRIGTTNHKPIAISAFHPLEINKYSEATLWAQPGGGG